MGTSLPLTVYLRTQSVHLKITYFSSEKWVLPNSTTFSTGLEVTVHNGIKVHFK